MQPIISVENISKRYHIAHEKERYVALRDIISESLFHPIKTAKKNIRKITGKDNGEDFWALRDINFTVDEGEVVGIIGKNGAGKSTLLKILTKITPPTTGEIRMRGRVASLLEVGTGFHPELTGRENIYLNGAILGMTRREINSKFKDIVEFAGIEQFLDTPVKRYSSGMYVRLGFSIAAHVEPEILLVDEVLAVGDAEFQKRCLGKMEEVTRSKGRTILFVSHNMSAIQKLCKRTLLINKGKLVTEGPTRTVVEKYLSEEFQDTESVSALFPLTAEDVVIKSFKITQDGANSSYIESEKTFQIDLAFDTLRDLTNFRFGVYIKDSSGDDVVRSFSGDWDPTLSKIAQGSYTARITIPELLLREGIYHIVLHASCSGRRDYLSLHNIYKTITVSRPAAWNVEHPTENVPGAIFLKNRWELFRS